LDPKLPGKVENEPEPALALPSSPPIARLAADPSQSFHEGSDGVSVLASRGLADSSVKLPSDPALSLLPASPHMRDDGNANSVWGADVERALVGTLVPRKRPMPLPSIGANDGAGFMVTGGAVSDLVVSCFLGGTCSDVDLPSNLSAYVRGFPPGGGLLIFGP